MAETKKSIQIEVSFSSDGAFVVIKERGKEPLSTTQSSDSLEFGKVMVACLQALFTQAFFFFFQIILSLLKKI